LSESDLDQYETADEQLPLSTHYTLRPSDYHQHPRRTLPTAPQTRRNFYTHQSEEDSEELDSATDTTFKTVHTPHDTSDRNTEYEDSNDSADGPGSISDRDNREDKQTQQQATPTTRITTLPTPRTNNRIGRYSPITIKLATYNIRDARNTRLQQACLNLEQQKIDVAFLTEMQIPSSAPIHTRKQIKNYIRLALLSVLIVLLL
jgi:hypothetical protein